MLIIIGRSRSGKSYLSSQLISEYPNKFYFDDYDKIAGRASLYENKNFDEAERLMAEFIKKEIEICPKDKILILNSISDGFIEKTPTDFKIKKVYIDDGNFVDIARVNGVQSFCEKRDFLYKVKNWNIDYNPDTDFLYNRKNYNELIKWIFSA